MPSELALLGKLKLIGLIALRKMYPLKRFIQYLANLPTSIKLRNLFGILPKYYNEPPLDYSVSDLFFWRSDAVWRTRLDLLNVPSILYPKKNIFDKVTLVFYDKQGHEFLRKQITIPPFQTRAIQIEDILEGKTGFGSVACFHEASEGSPSASSQTCIVERGFIAYRRVTDDSPLWSYVHGAAYVLAKPPDHDEVLTTRRTLGKSILYRPQLSLSDCDRFELIYINPNDCDLDIKVRLFDQTLQVIREESGVLPPRGVKYFSLDNKDRAIYRLENESYAHMLRPFVLKYYETHFDIFHS
jgi:hypothetical protein